MPLQILTPAQVRDGLRGHVQAELPAWDTSVAKRSYIGGLIKAIALTVSDVLLTFARFVDRQTNPQSATGDYLLQGWWRAITRLDPLPASPARGFIAVVAAAGTEINTGSLLTSGNTSYRVVAPGIVAARTLALISVLRGDGIWIAETASDHNIATGMIVSVGGLDRRVTVTAANEFTFADTGLAVTASTASVTFAPVLVEALTTGQATNRNPGTAFEFSAGLVDATATVTFGGIGGGAAKEDQESYRARILEALGADYGMFTPDEISIVAKDIPGVTRVFVRRAMRNPPPGWPLEGQCRVAFLRDHDADPIPSPQEVAAVRDHLVATLLPAHAADDDGLEVLAPLRYPVNYRFTALSPDTPGMRAAIRAGLRQFHAESVAWGEIVPQDDYRCAIREQRDMSSGVKLKSFGLAHPVGDITPGHDDIATLGTIEFPG
jgi:uncharacterized phage protein gp47/JayE